MRTVGEPDVLGREDDHPPGDESSVLARFEHPGEPVDGGVGVGSPHRLDERADHVVVVVASVAQRGGAQRRLDVFEFDVAVPGERARHLERGEHLSAVTAGPVDEQRRSVVVGGRSFGFEPAAHQGLDGGTVERFEPEQRRTAPQRRVDLEERVLGGGPDQRERAVLDGGQQRILLRLGEAVDLVEEQDRSLATLTESLAGSFDRLADVLDARR